MQLLQHTLLKFEALNWTYLSILYHNHQFSQMMSSMPLSFYTSLCPLEFQVLIEAVPLLLSLIHIQMCIRDSSYSHLKLQGMLLPPVSYTHLDVYKRQILNRVITNITIKIQPIASVGIFLCKPSNNRVVEPGPVSYTHLDVYKRQVKDRCYLRFRLTLI